LKLPEVKVSRFVDFEIGSNIEAVKAPKVWNELKTRGENIVIAGADTGFDYRHPALRKKYRGTQVFSINHDYNWRDAITKGGNRQCPAKSPEPCDDGDHGTHTMGTMVGDDEGENQIGVAPGARWIGCRNMNVGAGTVSTYLDCMEFFIAPYPVGGDSRRDGKPEMAPHIINNSWGCPTSEGCKGDEFVNSIRALKAAGIIFVAAAGNEGPGCGSVGDPPGTYYGDIVSVGALDHRNNTIASFSSRGPSAFNGAVGIDLVAPGNSVRSTVPGGKYESKAGTSMASPHVAGAIALLWSYRPELLGKVDQTLEQLRKTAIPMTSTLTCGQYPGANRPNTTFGYGALDTYQLLTQ
jgi:subtilisin family serine protease